jgi:hypothetical protein
VSSDVPSARAAWRFLVTWGGLAVVTLASAAYLTHLVTSLSITPYNVLETDFQEVGIFATTVPAPTDSARVVYNYDENSGCRILPVFWKGAGFDFSALESCQRTESMGTSRVPGESSEPRSGHCSNVETTIGHICRI